MSNRSMLEFNHDHAPMTERQKAHMIDGLMRYLASGDPEHLPIGVTWFGLRHHSDPCPLGEPPRGWSNDRRPAPAPAEKGETE